MGLKDFFGWAPVQRMEHLRGPVQDWARRRFTVSGYQEAEKNLNGYNSGGCRAVLLGSSYCSGKI